MQRQRAALAEALERMLERLAEVEAVGDAGQRIVVRQPSIFCLGAALLGDVLLNVDPAAVGQRLIGDEQRAAAAQVLDLRE